MCPKLFRSDSSDLKASHLHARIMPGGACSPPPQPARRAHAPLMSREAISTEGVSCMAAPAPAMRASPVWMALRVPASQQGGGGTGRQVKAPGQRGWKQLGWRHGSTGGGGSMDPQGGWKHGSTGGVEAWIHRGGGSRGGSVDPQGWKHEPTGGCCRRAQRLGRCSRLHSSPAVVSARLLAARRVKDASTSSSSSRSTLYWLRRRQRWQRLGVRAGREPSGMARVVRPESGSASM
jgi:hypothetical protein